LLARDLQFGSEGGVKEFIKVCDLSDLPPGKGRIIRIGSQSVCIFNQEGRIFAALEELGGLGAVQGAEAPLHERPAACGKAMTCFDVEQEDSPARAMAHARGLPVRVTRREVFVALEARSAG
jgi:nitrite reductase/ring-hydroxylating ferredoxin subunit